MLVAPITRKTQNSRQSDGGGSVRAVSLMGLRWIAFQPVDRAGLGRRQRQPVGRDLLQFDEEGLTGGEGLGTDIARILEAELVGEFTHEGMVVATRAPQGEIGRRGRVVMKGKLADVLQQF